MFDFGFSVFNRIFLANTLKDMFKCIFMMIMIGELNAIIGKYFIDLYGTALMRLSKNSAAIFFVWLE